MSYEEENRAWREARVARLTAADGWLSLVGKFELPEGESGVGSAPGCEVLLPEGKAPPRLATLTRRGAQLELTPAPGAALGIQRAHSQLSAALEHTTVLQSDAQGAPDRVVYGPLRIEVMERGALFAARVRDLESQQRRQFAGIDYFPFDEAWRVSARFVPHDTPQTLELLFDGGSELMRSPGVLFFSWRGVEYRLDPVFDSNPERLYLLFGDLTNRSESYGAGRFLYTPLPQDGRVLLDFSRAFNPPCAFTPYATCPLTPPQNRLQLRVEAGEKRLHA